MRKLRLVPGKMKSYQQCSCLQAKQLWQQQTAQQLTTLLTTLHLSSSLVSKILLVCGWYLSIHSSGSTVSTFASFTSLTILLCLLGYWFLQQWPRILGFYCNNWIMSLFQSNPFNPTSIRPSCARICIEAFDLVEYRFLSLSRAKSFLVELKSSIKSCRDQFKLCISLGFKSGIVLLSSLKFFSDILSPCPV